MLWSFFERLGSGCEAVVEVLYATSSSLRLVV